MRLRFSRDQNHQYVTFLCGCCLSIGCPLNNHVTACRKHDTLFNRSETYESLPRYFVKGYETAVVLVKLGLGKGRVDV